MWRRVPDENDLYVLDAASDALQKYLCCLLWRMNGTGEAVMMLICRATLAVWMTRDRRCTPFPTLQMRRMMMCDGVFQKGTDECRLSCTLEVM